MFQLKYNVKDLITIKLCCNNTHWARKRIGAASNSQQPCMQLKIFFIVVSVIHFGTVRNGSTSVTPDFDSESDIPNFDSASGNPDLDSQIRDADYDCASGNSVFSPTLFNGRCILCVFDNSNSGSKFFSSTISTFNWCQHTAEGSSWISGLRHHPDRTYCARMYRSDRLDFWPKIVQGKQINFNLIATK